MLANNGKRSTKTELIYIRFLNEYFQTSVGKWLTIDSKKSRMSQFLSLAKGFCEFLLATGKFRF